MNKILLKFSGEFFASGNQPIAVRQALTLANDIKKLYQKNIKVAVVVGAGNIIRGAQIAELSRIKGDYAGMCAALINGLILQAALEKIKVPAVLDSTLNLVQASQPFSPDRAKNDFNAGKVLIFGGTGLPYVTTDTAAVIFGASLEVDQVIKLTKVNGVYDSDPKQNKKAKKFLTLTHDRVLADKLKVMDMAALALARELNLSIRVCKWQPGKLLTICQNKNYGTIIK